MKRLIVITLTVTAMLTGAEAPQLKSITLLPPPTSELALGSCASPDSGYLGVGTRTDLTDAEVGQYVKTALRDGYVVTLYPTAKRGIYATTGCPRDTSR